MALPVAWALELDDPRVPLQHLECSQPALCWGMLTECTWTMLHLCSSFLLAQDPA